MSEQMLLRTAFVDFLQQMLPLIIDPLLIVQSHFKNLQKILEDKSKTPKNIIEFIDKHKFQPKTEKIPAQYPIVTEPASIPPDLTKHNDKLSQVQTTSQNRRYHRRYLSHQTDILQRIKKENLQDITTIQEEIQQTSVMYEKVQVQQPAKLNCQFLKFLQIQQNNGFSIVSKECILDDLEVAMIEFRRNTKTLLCMTERSSMVNTSESNEVDKSLENKDYNFSKYVETLSQQQENKTNQNSLRKGNNFNILQKYKTINRNQ